MKKVHKSLILTLILLSLMAIGQISQAQAPPPPPGTKGGDNNVPGGGAPIGSGIVLLISLAAGYGGKKIYDVQRNLGNRHFFN